MSGMRGKKLGLACFLVTVAAMTGWALINPNYTPVHLVEGAEFIIIMKLGPCDEKGLANAEILRVLKGEEKAPKGNLVFDVGQAINKETFSMIRDRIAAGGNEPALFFVGKDENGEEVGLVHLGGKWLQLGKTDSLNKWEVYRFEDKMEATWAGGTDMLIKMTELLVKYPDTEVPVAVGTEWGEKVKVGTLPGRVGEIQAVDLEANGKPYMYVACDGGDRLYRWNKAAGSFEDLTEKRKLVAKSRVAAWGDFNGDGLLDLASWDGKALTVHFLTKEGSFRSVAVTSPMPAESCLALTPMDAGIAPRSGLLWSSPKGPILLTPKEENAFDARPLLGGGSLPEALGEPGRCLVADFDDDGFADVLQTGSKGSLFFRGKGKGTFADPVPCAVALGKSPADAFIGDWDMDGRFDVFCVADDGCRLWHNYPGLDFKDRIHISGEIAYISKPGGIMGNVCDVNNDGLQDIFIVYGPNPDTGPQTFFNRGFRSTGHAHAIDISEQGLLGDEERAGQQSGLLADLTHDNAQDLAVVLKNGDFYVFPRSAEFFEPLCVRVAFGLNATYMGPLKVTASTERRCLGAWNVIPGVWEAFFGQSEPGGKLTIEWQFPGGSREKKTVELADKAVRIVLPSPK
ncbi:MAG: VCBS repeat-containing protein [Kiritimatiellae bacterium]|nr:VCBS repeat-containing protein [Kiritimatiellia bacterium]